MSDLSALRKLREQPFFLDWKGSVPDQTRSDSGAALRQLVEDLMRLGNEPDEDDARVAVAKCVKRFNELDAGWITTIEREDISDAIYKVVETAGFDCDEDWIDDREW